MEKFISKDYLSEYFYVKESNYTTIVNESKTIRNRASYYSEVTVFLSHKHEETDVLNRIIVLLKKLGVSVYVDWLDEGMPKTTSGATAKRIKQKIENCKKFIFLATVGAINSKWCNWELGFGDAKKYPQNIAVFPITETKGSTWDGSEYLQIYPIITTDRVYSLGEYYVEFNGLKQKLADWLKQ